MVYFSTQRKDSYIRFGKTCVLYFGQNIVGAVRGGDLASNFKMGEKEYYAF